MKPDKFRVRHIKLLYRSWRTKTYSFCKVIKMQDG